MYSPLLAQMIDALRCLPGVGPKSAQRMAFHLLERDRNSALKLATALVEAVENIGHCQICRNLSETDLCEICNNTARTESQLCVVETPADVVAIEQSTQYSGRYFVLMGRLSPLDGIGPKELGLDHLATQLQHHAIEEIILATNPTVEGEATAHYIQEMARQHQIKTTRIAHGVPLGGELEYVDRGTLAHAFSGRRDF